MNIRDQIRRAITILTCVLYKMLQDGKEYTVIIDVKQSKILKINYVSSENYVRVYEYEKE